MSFTYEPASEPLHISGGGGARLRLGGQLRAADLPQQVEAPHAGLSFLSFLFFKYTQNGRDSYV